MVKSSIKSIVDCRTVRKLIGKPRVPYNRGLRLQGSSHPFFDYGTAFSPPTAASNVCRIQPDLLCLACRTAWSSCFASGGVSLTATITPFAFCVPIFGLPACFFIINVIQISCI